MQRLNEEDVRLAYEFLAHIENYESPFELAKLEQKLNIQPKEASEQGKRENDYAVFLLMFIEGDFYALFNYEEILNRVRERAMFIKTQIERGNFRVTELHESLLSQGTATNRTSTSNFALYLQCICSLELLLLT